MTAPDTFPPQAWAHASGKVDLHLVEPADWSADALSARAQIADALYRFVTARDEARSDVAVSCFLADGVLEASTGGSGTPTLFEGRSRIFERFESMKGNRHDQRRHITSNVMVDQLDLEVGTAAAIASCVVSVAADGISVGASVIYAADLRRDLDGCWRFARLFLGLDHYEGPTYRDLPVSAAPPTEVFGADNS